MGPSIWTATLASLRDRVAGTDPAPAGVTAAAVAASLGLSLLIKVLEIAGKRKDFTGDGQRLAALLESARLESAHLAQAADEDIEAVHQLLENRAVIGNAIEVPMRAARSAVAGLDLCADAAGMIHGLVSADLGAAAALLTGAARAILLCVDSNLRLVRSDTQYHSQVAAESRELQDRLSRRAEALPEVMQHAEHSRHQGDDE